MKSFLSNRSSVIRCYPTFESFFIFCWSYFFKISVIDWSDGSCSYVVARMLSPIRKILNLGGNFEVLSINASVIGLLTGGLNAVSCLASIALVCRGKFSLNTSLIVCLTYGVASRSFTPSLTEFSPASLSRFIGCRPPLIDV